MTLLVKDANTAVQPLSTQSDVAGALAPVHVPAAVVGGVATPASASAPLPVTPSLIVSGTATPVSSTAPMPVTNTAAVAAIDGSGLITVGNVAQGLFGGAVPRNGWLVCNNSISPLYVSDIGEASASGSSIQIAPGATFTTPSGYKPPGAVSIFGGTTGQPFAARSW